MNSIILQKKKMALKIVLNIGAFVCYTAWWPSGVAAGEILAFWLCLTSAYVRDRSQQRIWRPAQIGILLLSLQQRNQELGELTWQMETSTKERTSSSITYVRNQFQCFLSVLRSFVGTEIPVTVPLYLIRRAVIASKITGTGKSKESDS